MANDKKLVAHVRSLLESVYGDAPDSPSRLWHALEQSDKPMPMGRSTFYAQLAYSYDGSYSPRWVDLIPPLARAFRVSAARLYLEAEVLTHEEYAGLNLNAAAKDLRSTLRQIESTLINAGLDSSLNGEALLLQRLLLREFDVKVSFWPIVRGTEIPLHLHSWIGIERMDAGFGIERKPTRELWTMTPDEQRELLEQAIGVELWRSLGLRWVRPNRDEFPDDRTPALCIEIPVFEASSAPDASRSHSVRLNGILVVSPPFAHGELLAAFLHHALGIGLIDLRYQGFREDSDKSELRTYCLNRLRAHDSVPYAWCIAETSEVLKALAPAIFEYASTGGLLITISYGEATRALGARIWRLSESQLDGASEAIAEILTAATGHENVLSIDFDEADYVTCSSTGESVVDFNLLTETVRVVARRVLGLLARRELVSRSEEWDGRIGGAGQQRVTTRATWVPRT